MTKQPQDKGNLPAQHYLKIWQGRLSMAERGVISPPPYLILHVRELVAGLAAVDPATEVRLERNGNQMRFIAAETGGILGGYPLFGPTHDDHEPESKS